MWPFKKRIRPQWRVTVTRDDGARVTVEPDRDLSERSQIFDAVALASNEFRRLDGE